MILPTLCLSCKKELPLTSANDYYCGHGAEGTFVSKDRRRCTIYLYRGLWIGFSFHTSNFNIQSRHVFPFPDWDLDKMTMDSLKDKIEKILLLV